jgi:hypothetical protein
MTDTTLALALCSILSSDVEQYFASKSNASRYSRLPLKYVSIKYRTATVLEYSTEMRTYELYYATYLLLLPISILVTRMSLPIVNSRACQYSHCAPYSLFTFI